MLVLDRSFRSTVLLCTSVLACMNVFGQDPAWTEPPRLVVGVVVDQMRVDYIYRYWDNFGDGGFKRLINEGSFQRNAQFDYAPTETGPGHASIYTGTTPSDHGITFNDMFIGMDHAHNYCVSDPNVKGVGCEAGSGLSSPLNLLASSIADELELATERRSKTIGIALKDRAAILPVGRTGDAAYWFMPTGEGAFVTSTWYRNELPDWLVAFNAEKRPLNYLKNTWELSLPLERYRQVMPDDNPYEEPLPGTTTSTLPMDLQAMFKATGSAEVIKYTPWGSTLTTDMALAAIAGEGLGADDVTDLLAISYSSPDELGHEVGPRAVELEDMYVRLDSELKRLFDELDTRVGKDKYTVFLTADHGVVDVPQYLKDLKSSAGYIDKKSAATELNKALVSRFGEGEWVRTIRRGQVFLNDSLIQARKVIPEEIQRASVDHLQLDPNVIVALTATDLARNQYTEGVRRTIQRGFMIHRSGDVVMVYRPNYLESYNGITKGTTHMTPWNYDTQVPVIFFGQGIRKGEILERTSITDIAPTVCAIVGISLPNAASGNVVEKALK